MDRENNQSFIRNVESDLASVRSGLLIAAQSCDASDLAVPRRDLARLHADSAKRGIIDVTQRAAECLACLDGITDSPTVETARLYSALDMLAAIEAAVWKLPLTSENFLEDVSGFVDASFEGLVPRSAPPVDDDWGTEGFEIDDETLDIFRSEAEELLGNIKSDITVLQNSPADQNALWEIRRNSHTFKGAAGIVGMTEASNIAHRMEDLLDKMVELHLAASPELIDFLDKSCSRLDAISAARDLGADVNFDAEFHSAMASLSKSSGSSAKPADDRKGPGTKVQSENQRPTSTPIVRVSLDRLDELLSLSRSLRKHRTSLAEKFAEYSIDAKVESKILATFSSILDGERQLTDELHAKLLRIRMVRFGTLETRLSRAVHMTCTDEGKKASVVVENPDVEIDTQIIDALIEPLLHLLKNSVVHGIELPDTRRLIGKPEAGTIRICLEADDEALVLTISDDGGGISIPRLLEKAVANRILTTEAAAEINDRDALRLIFDRGLTTATKLDLNAGRGVGMSIVKESIESRGGSVLVESETRRGTTFTILLPLAPKRQEEFTVRPEPLEKAVGPNPLVLVVDDSASIRRHNTKLVENVGLRVITANNGAEALEFLLNSTFEPDFIISDIEMPQIDGLEFLEYVKSDENFGHIPVAMVTSLSDDVHRSRAMNLGASEYFIKPLRKEHLVSLLETLGISVRA